jgi:phosphoglycolate phosphatase
MAKLHNLLSAPVEWVADQPQDRDYRAVLFDFDGTLSFLRGGWPGIMIPMMVDALIATGTAESPAALTELVEEFVMRLNGRPAINQMRQLVDEIRQRKGHPASAEDYLAEYDRRLLSVVDRRIADIREGRESPTDWAIGGAVPFLNVLQAQGLKLALASGTFRQFVVPEAELLGVAPFFGPEINAPEGSESSFSKRGVIERILKEWDIPPEALLSFGDGVVETQEVSRLGGTAIAVASREDRTPGIDPDKRARLIEAGAHGVIADYGFR